MKSPCMEAEYAIDERTTLSLYDCMVPKLKEHRRFKIQKDSPFSLADFKMQLKIKEYENSMEVRQLPRLKQEHLEAIDKIKYLESELDIVKWYIAVMEDGKDTKKIMEEHYNLIQEYKLYRKDKEKRIDTLIGENIKLENNFRETKEKLL